MNRDLTPRQRLTRRLAVPALVAVVAALTALAPLGGSAQAGTATATPLAGAPARTVTGNLLAFNDFHGNIDPPTGSGGLVNGTPAGGVEYLAYWVKKLRAQELQHTPYVITVSAGDNIGASPLVSAAFHDEPAIEELNALGLDVSSVGNHEFDEGITELKRMQFGGCHPVDGCQDGDGFDGADFPYLAANVVDKQTNLPILLPVSIEFVGTVPVAFVGMTLKNTGTIVNPAGVATVDFKDEVQTANTYAKFLGLLGIRSLVLVVHQGGFQNPVAPALAQPDGCANFSGDIVPIVAGLNPAYGVVVSGHTHAWYNCQLPNSSGATSLVTSAGSFGRLVTDISVTLDTRTRAFVSASAHNQIVENGIQNPDGTWQRDASGNFVRDPAKVDPQAKTIADKYRVAVAPLANRVVGSITADITNAALPSGESRLGDVIADAQLAYTQSAGAQIALMNPGGIRASLIFTASVGGEAPGQVTYGECFTVQPFNNLVVTQTLTGAQLKDTLEQQFPGTQTPPQTSTRILQISAGFTYDLNAAAPTGSRISNLKLNGVAIDPAATYRVTTNDFLANGGDGFTVLTGGTNRQTAPGFDIDALVAYLTANSPVAPGPGDRITKVG